MELIEFSLFPRNVHSRLSLYASGVELKIITISNFTVNTIRVNVKIMVKAVSTCDFKISCYSFY